MESSGSVPLAIGQFSSQPLILGTNNTEWMRITSGGNVGIGNTAPSTKLDIVGRISLGADDASPADRNAYINGGNDTATGSENVGFGSKNSGVLSALTTGNWNSAFGGGYVQGPGYALTSGDYNNLFGRGAGLSLTEGNSNNAFGNLALQSITTTSNNTAFGESAGRFTTGSNNTFIGYQAGDNLLAGSNNIVLGYNIDTPSTTSSNTLNIGNLIFGTSINGTGTTLSSGNVGIGTTAPSTKLTISGSTPAIYLNTATGEIPLTIQANNSIPVDSTNPYIRTGGGGSLQINSSAASGIYGKLYLNPDKNSDVIIASGGGNVGIGTVSPTAKLDISGTARVTSFSSPTSGVGVEIDYGAGAASTGRILTYDRTGAVRKDLQLDALNLYFLTNTGTEAMRINSSGNVGIGTTSPSYLLDINSGSTTTPLGITSNAQLGGVQLIGNQTKIFTIAPSSVQGWSLGVDGTDAGALVRGNFYIESNAASVFKEFTLRKVNSVGRIALNLSQGVPGATMHILGEGTGSAISLLTQGSSTPGTASGIGLAVLDNGNVGIGTTAPSFPLDVASTVSSNQTYGYLNSSGVVGTSSGTNTYSIRASGRILSSEFNAVSDARLKDVQFDLDPAVALNAILQLKPVSFTWKDNPSGQPILGLLAQDVEGVIPNAVSKVATSKFVDQRELSYNQLTAVLIGAIKKQQQQIDQINIREIPNQVRDDRLPSNDKIASIEAALASLKTDMDVMKNNNGETRLIASLPTLSSLDSATATLSALIVSGKSNLYDVGISGTLTAGILNINGLDDSLATASATIETVGGPLRIQPNALSNIEFSDGKIVMDTKGNLTVHGEITAQKINIDTSPAESAAAGKAVVKAGEQSITVETTAVTENSLIMVTFNTNYAPATRYWIESKNAGTSFTLKLDQTVGADTEFSYMIVN